MLLISDLCLVLFGWLCALLSLFELWWPVLFWCSWSCQGLWQVCMLLHSAIRFFIRSFIHSFACSFIRVFIHSVSQSFLYSLWWCFCTESVCERYLLSPHGSGPPLPPSSHFFFFFFLSYQRLAAVLWLWERGSPRKSAHVLYCPIKFTFL